MRLHARSIHGCTAAPAGFVEPEACRYTFNPETGRLYLHLFSWPDRRVLLPGMAERLEYAQLLHDGSEITMTEHSPGNIHTAKIPPGAALLALPVNRPDVAGPVVELFLKS